jgi:hypothetical protein
VLNTLFSLSDTHSLTLFTLYHSSHPSVYRSTPSWPRTHSCKYTHPSLLLLLLLLPPPPLPPLNLTPPFRWQVNTLTSLPNGNPLTTPTGGPKFEEHGPYDWGWGFPAINGQGGPGPLDPQIPLTGLNAGGVVGVDKPNVFVSEFGCTCIPPLFRTSLRASVAVRVSLLGCKRLCKRVWLCVYPSSVANVFVSACGCACIPLLQTSLRASLAVRVRVSLFRFVCEVLY